MLAEDLVSQLAEDLVGVEGMAVKAAEVALRVAVPKCVQP
tara:strand:+ start:612 stop:731 length:120 start_codon:yes stop_codon:yes gene_type:complete